MSHIQFGLTLPSPRQLPRADYLATIQRSLELATGHFDSIWFTDHLQKAFNINNITPDRGFVGTPAQVIEQMRPFIDLGVDYFMLGMGGFPTLAPLQTLIDEVIPILNR